MEVLAFCLVLQDYSHISGRIRWHCLASGLSSFIVRQEELIIGKTAELFGGVNQTLAGGSHRLLCGGADDPAWRRGAEGLSCM